MVQSKEPTFLVPLKLFPSFFSSCEIAAGGVGFLNLFSSRLGGQGNDVWVVGFHHLKRNTPKYIPAG